MIIRCSDAFAWIKHFPGYVSFFMLLHCGSCLSGMFLMLRNLFRCVSSECSPISFSHVYSGWNKQTEFNRFLCLLAEDKLVERGSDSSTLLQQKGERNVRKSDIDGQIVLLYSRLTHCSYIRFLSLLEVFWHKLNSYRK